MLSPITQQILNISDSRDIKELRVNITLAVNSLLEIDHSELIHRLKQRNASDSPHEPTTFFAFHKTSTQGDIEKESIPLNELIANWPTEPVYSVDADKPNIIPMQMSNDAIEYLKFFSVNIDSKTIANLGALTRVYRNQCELILNAENDQLTGLSNRQAFARITTSMFSTQETASIEYHQLEQSACMAIIDLDYFKRVNDKFGHLYGDEVLLLFSRLMVSSLRSSDYIFRYGGEEFVIILNDTNTNRASTILNRLRKNAENFDYPQIGRITISVGYALMKKELGISAIMDIADIALYYSKDNGRNQVNNYHDLLDKGLIADKVADDTINIF